MPGRTVAAGALRHRVTIQGRSIERDNAGGVAETWLNKQERWARVEPLKVDEKLQGMKTEAIGTHTITLRTYPDLTHSMRFVWGARTFGIVEITKDQELPDRFQRVIVREKR